jgi:uncharacterized protein YndB with AHSA1/START domain
MTHPIGDRFGLEQAPEPAKTIQASVEIAAPPDVVFRALADPRELAAWLGDAHSGDALHELPKESTRDAASDERSDAASPSLAPFTRPGGGARWLAHARAPDGTPGTISGEFLSVVPSRSLITTWAASWNRFVQDEVTFQLAPIDVAGVAGTRVTVTHRRRSDRILHDATIASARAMAAAEDDAWAALLAQLSAYVTTIDALARWGDPAGSDLTQAFDALHRRVVAIHQGESA